MRTGDWVPRSMADVNGDGYADLALGNFTSVILFHSSGSAGITATTVTAGPSGPTQIIAGETGSDGFGAAIGFSDTHAAGYPDLIVAATEVASNTGKVYAFPSVGTAGVGVGGDQALGATLAIVGHGTGNSFGATLP